jgi:hypothetical protein
MTARPTSLARRAAAVVLLFSLVWGLACAPKDKDKAVVATVNGEDISSLELKAQVAVFKSIRPGAADDQTTRAEVLDQMIKQRLLVQMARQGGLDKDPRNRSLIEQRRKDLRAQLEKNIADAQAQLQSLDAAVEARTLIEALSQARRVSMTVTAKDLEAAYKIRAQQASLPPLAQVHDQLLEQVILDRLVEQARKDAKIDIRSGDLP